MFCGLTFSDYRELQKLSGLYITQPRPGDSFSELCDMDQFTKKLIECGGYTKILEVLNVHLEFMRENGSSEYFGSTLSIITFLSMSEMFLKVSGRDTRVRVYLLKK